MSASAMEMTTLFAMAGHLIRRIHQISGHTFQVHLEKAGYDLTPVQFATMQALRVSPGLEQAQVAAMIGYDRATIGGVIDRLEHKGFIFRKISARDRRAREVTLTDSGQLVMNEVYPVVEKLQIDILDGLDEMERAQFLSLAQKVVVKSLSEK